MTRCGFSRPGISKISVHQQKNKQKHLHPQIRPSDIIIVLWSQSKKTFLSVFCSVIDQWLRWNATLSKRKHWAEHRRCWKNSKSRNKKKSKNKQTRQTQIWPRRVTSVCFCFCRSTPGFHSRRVKTCHRILKIKKETSLVFLLFAKIIIQIPQTKRRLLTSFKF